MRIRWLSEGQAAALNCPLRLIQVAGGERAGKSFISGLFGATRTPYGELFWVVGPDYALARPEFNYWTEHLLEMGAIASQRKISAPKVGPARAETKTGQVIVTKTADEVAKLAAVAPSGIIMAEAAQQSYESYLRCIGRVAEKRGWLLMSGTFEGSAGWFVDNFNEWQNPENVHGGISISVPSWENLQVYPGGRQDPEILRLEHLYERVEGFFEERLGARPVPSVWLVFRGFRHHIHMDPSLRFDRNLPVYLAIDPSSGTNPYSVLACQFRIDPDNRDHPDPIDYCNVIDELYETDMIAESIIKKAKRRRWWKNVRGGAIDVEAPDERKRWLKYGKVRLHAEKWPVVSGIRRMKTFLYFNEVTNELPHLQIATRVKSLPFECGMYKRRPPKDEDWASPELPPIHQHDHSLKALWYLLLARYGDVKGKAIPKPVYRR